MKAYLRRMRKNYQLYLFLLIPSLYVLIFSYIPMAGITLAFKKFNPNLGIWGSPWIGTKNFSKFFSSYMFERVLTNTIRLSVYQLLAGFPLPILFALMLNTVRVGRFKKTVQTITYMPHFISTVVLVSMVIKIFNPLNGIYGRIWMNLFGEHGPDLLASPNSFVHMYVWSGIWQEFGWNSIIYIAALAAVSPELHEAAEIDGATRLQRVIHVDLPCIIPTATIMLILSFGRIMGIGFEKVYLMQNSLNLRMSEVISTYTYKVGLGSAIGGKTDYPYATAIGLFNSLVNMTMVVCMNWITRKLSDTSLW
ncbi:MAG: sugar ABC transporter permease [Clostridia bacterium]|nr:sugar ABC transporter permease [Clostridia bacterium]